MNCDCNTPNRCIECSVTSCKYHCNSEDFCSLSKITVGTHEPHPTETQCTDCQSFEVKY